MNSTQILLQYSLLSKIDVSAVAEYFSTSIAISLDILLRLLRPRIKDQGSRIGWSYENALDFVLKKVPSAPTSWSVSCAATKYQKGGLPRKLQAKSEKQVAVRLLGTRLIEREASCRQMNDVSPQAAESAGIKKSHMPQVFE